VVKERESQNVGGSVGGKKVQRKRNGKCGAHLRKMKIRETE